MKKILVGLTIATMLVIAPSAIAAQKKPPKDLCLEWESNSNYHHLAIEQSGKIYDKDHTMKTYVITGVDQNGTISGSGYIARGTSTLLATYNGMHNGDTLSNYQLKYNLTTKSGTIYYRYDAPPDNEPVTSRDTVYKIGCRKLNIPPIE